MALMIVKNDLTNQDPYKISQVIKSEIQNTKSIEGAKAIMLKNAIGEIGSKKEIKQTNDQ